MNINININFLENNINISNEYISVLELENKKTFYRIVKLLNKFSLGENIEEIDFYIGNEEKDSIKINLFLDYFNWDLNSKKTNNELQKNIIDKLDEASILELTKIYKKLYNTFNKMLLEVELPLEITQDFDINTFIKNMKVTLQQKNELLDNLLLLIDINSILKLNDILVFINLKQYLSNAELLELYKYSIYNNIKILLIDSQSYGPTLEFEKKLIVDENLDEFVL